jgi:hypothetical protein
VETIATTPMVKFTLSPEMKEQIRELRRSDPDKYTVPTLSKQFNVSPYVIMQVAPLDPITRERRLAARKKNKEKPDIEAWKAKILKKEHERWANRKEEKAKKVAEQNELDHMIRVMLKAHQKASMRKSIEHELEESQQAEEEALIKSGQKIPNKDKKDKDKKGK